VVTLALEQNKVCSAALHLLFRPILKLADLQLLLDAQGVHVRARAVV